MSDLLPRLRGVKAYPGTDRVTPAAYDHWAPIYDVVFGPVFRQGRRMALEAAARVGGRVLEVGVGTGLSLADYQPSSTVFGFDISAPMLRKAQSRVSRQQLAHVGGLAVMDAEHLAFDDSSFDVIMAQYVVTAVPNPERALDEFLRVLRPDGEIIIATRVGAETGLRGCIERLLMPVTSRLGWRTDFPWRRYANWIAGAPAAILVERRPLPPLGHFSLVRLTKTGPQAQQAPASDRSGHTTVRPLAPHLVSSSDKESR